MPLQLIATPPAVKTTRLVRSYEYFPDGLACTSVSSCTIVGDMIETQQSVVAGLTSDDLTDALALDIGTDSTYGVPVNVTPRESLLLSVPFSVNGVSCGRTLACGIAGAVNTATATDPFVMTTT